MTRVETLEQQVETLTPEELAVFRNWFAEFDAAPWDRQFEADVAAGRLDALAEEALESYRAGECKAL